MKRRVKRGRILFCGVIACTILGMLYFPIRNLIKPEPKVSSKLDENENDTQESQLTKDLKKATNNISLHSKYAILIDMKEGTVLFEQGANERMYPASLTKIMSCIVALMNIEDLQATIDVHEEDLAGLAEANASIAGFEVGDTLTYEQVLYGLLLPSGADAANILAHNLFGSMDAYVIEMNKLAHNIGMNNTNFKNASGLHDDQHYTTLNDLNRLMKHAWLDRTFQTMITSFTYDIPKSTIHSDGIHLQSTLLSYQNTSTTFRGGKIIGGKSGYTLEANCCLMSIARFDKGGTYMLISAKALGDPVEDHKHLNDAIHMYETMGSVMK